ncbi:MAG: ABC transporter ATP-binding protein [Candidatus Cloacimonetes bacterium]|nr:ABC transporter ATP-binding protein [Candidatus Cloacimonadota bacterium]
MSLLEIKSLTKHYGKFEALHDVSLDIPRGRIIGLLGKNGAGKSTLMRSVLGFLRYDGEIVFDGKHLAAGDQSIFERVAFIPDVNGLDDRLTVRQTMDYVAAMNPVWKEATASNLLAQSKLDPKAKVKSLSKGMKTKLYLLITLSLDVELLLLDEPTLGLDIVFRKEFFNTILGEFFDENKTIIISTHQVEEVEPILQDIIFLHEGKILLYEDIEELKSRSRTVTVPVDMRDKLLEHNPRLLTYTLGRISGIVDADVEIEGAEFSRPMLSDLFVAELGGYDA